MEPVQIGVKELYDLLKEVDTKMDALVTNHALLEQRVSQLERAVERRWLLYLALIAAFVSLLGSFIAPLIVR